jgi:hypothetical protein
MFVQEINTDIYDTNPTLFVVYVHVYGWCK